MVFDPLAWALGTAGKILMEKTIAYFFPDDLSANLKKAAEKWSKELPRDCFTPPEPLFEVASTQANDVCPPYLAALRDEIRRGRIPSSQVWHQSLLSHWQVRKTELGTGGNDFFQLSETAASGHLRKLADAFERVCINDASLFRQTTTSTLDEIREQVAGIPDAILKFLKKELDNTALEGPEKAKLLERTRSQLRSEQRLLEAVLHLSSEDPSISHNAAKELLEISDPRSIPTLVQRMSREIEFTPTKETVMEALQAFGKDAVPSLIDSVREHARLIYEQMDYLPVDPGSEGWRAAVLESDAGELLVRIGAASIPALQDLRNNEGLLGQAADALLSAVQKRE